MEVTYQLTEDDYRQGLRVWRTRTALRLWSLRISSALMVVVFVMGVVMLTWSSNLELKYFSWFELGLPVVYFLSLWIAPGIQARMQYRRMPGAQSPITMTLSDSEVHVRSKHYDSHVNWSTYIGWAEGKSVFVLFPQPRIYVPIPKRAFSNEQIELFREILRRNVGSR